MSSHEGRSLSPSTRRHVPLGSNTAREDLDPVAPVVTPPGLLRLRPRTGRGRTNRTRDPTPEGTNEGQKSPRRGLTARLGPVLARPPSVGPSPSWVGPERLVADPGVVGPYPREIQEVVVGQGVGWVRASILDTTVYLYGLYPGSRRISFYHYSLFLCTSPPRPPAPTYSTPGPGPTYPRRPRPRPWCRPHLLHPLPPTSPHRPPTVPPVPLTPPDPGPTYPPHPYRTTTVVEGPETEDQRRGHPPLVGESALRGPYTVEIGGDPWVLVSLPVQPHPTRRSVLPGPRVGWVGSEVGDRVGSTWGSKRESEWRTRPGCDVTNGIFPGT